MRGLPEPRSSLALREGYHSKQVDVAVRLNTNESPLPPPKEWIDAFTRAIAGLDYNRYPDRSATELRAALAQHHGVRTDQIFCANGSNEVLQSVCLAYGGPGRTAVTFEPTYALHAHIAHVTGTEVVEAPRRPDFSLDLDVMRESMATHQPVITFLCSPNNPTGLAEDRSSIEATLEAAPGLVIVDEAYGQFADWSVLGLIDDDVPLVVSRTFSKTWSMAAVRLGYLIAPAPVVTMLERVALPYHLDALKQIAGRLAVAYVDQMEERVGLLVRQRQRIAADLATLPITVWPSQANFILFRPDKHSAGAVWDGLLERGVLIRDTSTWPGLEGCLRVTVGSEQENTVFLDALHEVMA